MSIGHWGAIVADHSLLLELYYDGAWHYAPALTRDGCSIMRGLKTRGDSDPAEAAVTIDNSSELYSPRSIASALYGKIGQNTPARLSADDDVRLTGEVARWKPRRPIKGSGWTEIQIAGVLQRLGRGRDDVQSAATRAGLALGPFAYWPLESGAGAITPDTGALVPGADPSIPAIVWADDDTLLGSLPLPRVLTETSEWDVSVLVTDGVPTNSGTAWSISVWLRQEPLQDAVLDTWYAFFWDARPPGASQPWALQTSTSGSNSFGYTTGAGGAVATNHGPSLTDNAWHHVVMMAEQAGSTISGKLYIDGVEGTTITPATDTLQPLTSFSILPGDGLNIATPGANVWVGQLGFYDRMLTADEVEGLYLAGHGWDGELAEDRFTRLCEELAVTPTVVGTTGESVAMGVQAASPTLELLDEIARTDDASIFETRDGIGLTMRTGESKLNQAPALTLSYLGDIVPGLEPVFGDEGIRNDVTAANPAGTTRRVQQLTGPHNVQLPEDDPQGVGRYTTRIDVNPETGDALADAAGWRVNLGTHAGTWYAEVTADLDATPGLITAVNAIDIGDVIALTDLPVDEALNTVESIVIGIGEDLPPKRRKVTFYCVPADPYRAGVLAETSGDTGDFLGHIETDGSTTDGATAAGAATFSVATPSGALWTTDSDDFPQDFVVGGQRVSVSAISGASSPQTFTVATYAGALPIVYAIPAGSTVTAHQPLIPTL